MFADMGMVKLRGDILRADRVNADRWYVTNGTTAVGPIELALLERGLEAGKVPLESYVRHETWKIWRPLSELTIAEEQRPIDPLGTPLPGFPAWGPSDADLPTSVRAAPPAPIALPQDAEDFDPKETREMPAVRASRLGLSRDPRVDLPPSAHAPVPSAEGNDPLIGAGSPFGHLGLRSPPGASAPNPLRHAVQQMPIAVAENDVLSTIDIEPIEEEPEIEGETLDRSSEHEIAAIARAPRRGPPSVEDITLPAKGLKGRTEPAAEGAAPRASEATPMKDALLLLSSTILREVGCEGVMVHRVDDDGAVAVVAHGPRMFDVLGLRTRLLDPAIVAAAAGIFIVAEPTPGPAGQAIQARLEKLGVTGNGAAMLPIRPHGRLFGTVELGQSAFFQASALAKAESFVRTITTKLESAGWGG